MNILDLFFKVPAVKAWIEQLLVTHAPQARSVASYQFQRLPQFYSHAFLTNAKVVEMDVVPMPPIAKLGLPELSQFVTTEASGITYKNTYFVRHEEARNESLHFHELVHVVQWEHLGVNRFLRAYGEGLAKFGYRESPLEQMAYDLQAAFDRNEKPVDVEAVVRAKLDELYR